ncbi:hypothetical protein WJX77_009570 [Trebouxia sp. C0004]
MSSDGLPPTNQAGNLGSPGNFLIYVYIGDWHCEHKGSRPWGAHRRKPRRESVSLDTWHRAAQQPWWNDIKRYTSLLLIGGDMEHFIRKIMAGILGFVDHMLVKRTNHGSYRRWP